MKNRRQVIESLRYAREQRDKATAEQDATPFDSIPHDSARVNRLLWMGWCSALESVLNIEPEAKI